MSNGQDLLAEYKIRHNQVAAILTDIDMPKMDGIQAIEAIRAFERKKNLS